MEESLAREMARLKMDKEKQQREIEKICAESNELKELQAKIKSAYLNKERASQVAENQFRKQIDLVRISIIYDQLLIVVCRKQMLKLKKKCYVKKKSETIWRDRKTKNAKRMLFNKSTISKNRCRKKKNRDKKHSKNTSKKRDKLTWSYKK